MLTSRWFPLRRHAEQQRLLSNPSRFRVVPAGRRSGKTEIAKRYTIRSALAELRWDDARFFLAAPTRDQAKAIFWDDLKNLVPKRFLSEAPRETDLSVTLVNGASIHVIGMDKPERIEGRSWCGGILDEYANMKKEAWTQHVRPALSDRKGWCWMIGVPEGRGQYYQLFRHAKEDQTGEWAGFTWKSADILPADEIESARRDLDELTFQQEYEASFVTFHGRAYYPFDGATHCARLAYDPKQPLIFCFDFNVAPGVAAVCQEQTLPNGETGTGVIGEVWIPRNSNTESVCRRLAQDWGEHRGRIVCYGDASGGARGSAKVTGSDWDIIRRELQQAFGSRVLYRVPKANPSQRSRINAVNTRLKSGDGRIRLMIDPTKAAHVVTDFEGVRLLEGGAGEIDKKHDPEISHLSDSIGYYCVYEFPVSGQKSQQSGMVGLY